MQTRKHDGNDGRKLPGKTLTLRRALCGLVLAAVALVARNSLMAQQSAQEDDGAYSMGNGRMVRGTVTATAADHLTLKTDAGDTFQVVVTTNTRLMKDRQPVKLADVHPGDGVGAMGLVDAPTKTIHAAAVMVVDAAQIKKMKEDMGKTYINGKVTAIDDLELTVLRPDGVTQKIAVDEGTSFKKGGRRAAMMMRGDGTASPQASGSGATQGTRAADQGGESITLADIKVGDTVIGPGGLKAGVFVPTQLTVIDAAAMARRRRPESADPAPAAGANPH